MRKIVPILCILALSLSGCSSTTLLRNGVDELRDYIASENAKTKKKLDDRLNKKISTLNRAISEKNEEIIFELMADDLREDGDKLKSQLKDFVNFIPGKIVETSNRSWGTLIHAENYKDAPDNVIERKIWPHDDEGNYYCSDFISRCGIYRFEFIEKRNHYENWNYWSNGSRGQNSKRKIDRHDVMGTSRRFICFWFVRKTRGDCGSFRNW